MAFLFNAFDFFANLLVLSLLLLPLYYLIHSYIAQRIIMILGGAFLIFCIAPRLLLFYIVFWLAVWFLQNLLAATNQLRINLLTLWGAIFLVLIPMVIWKLFPNQTVYAMNVYLNEFLFQYVSPIGRIDAVRNYIIPIGFSFAIFRALDMLIKTNLFEVEKFSLLKVFYYGFFPPVLPVGPIIEYTEINLQERKATRFDKINIVEGLWDITTGVIKVYILSYPLRFSIDVFTQYSINNPSILIANLIIFSFYFYLNFAGYSSLAIGIARLYGFILQPNFCFPLFRNNPQQFWANWHMSLTRFAQRYIFIPLGGFRPQRQYIAILVTMMVIALWHDLSWQWIIFGAYHGTGLVMHRFYNNHKYSLFDFGLLKKTPLITNGLNRLTLFSFITLGFPIIMVGSTSEILPFYMSLFGLR